jgi:phage shock protein PspC (stress-responsive transcriptional regulator)
VPQQEPAPEEPRPWRERHLYRLTGPGEAQIAGVCAGIAAYLNIDVTVIRLVVVLLTIVTGGGAAVGYIAMALLVPEANSPERRAAARGYGETAQEIMSRARANAGPALGSLGSALLRIWQGLLDVLHGVAIAVTWLLLATWAALVVWVLADGDGILQAFDPGTSNWLVALWLTCIAWVLVSFFLRIAIASGRDDEQDATPRRHRSRTLAIARDSVWFVTVVGALLAVFAIPAGHSKQLIGLDDGQGRVHLFDEVICVQDDQHEGSASERCRKGDDVVRWNQAAEWQEGPAQPAPVSSR